MCYAIPGRVKSFDGKFAVVDYFGEEKKAINELTNLHTGDYVYAQGGFVISRVSRSEAESTLETWKDLFFELQELDAKSSQLTPWGRKKFDRVRLLMDRAAAGEKLTLEDILYLVRIKDPQEREFFFSAANNLRQKYHKNSCCVHGIVEISNYCAERCQYCGISLLNSGLTRYRMTPDEIFEAVRVAVIDHGFKALVLQSGEDAGRTVKELAEIVAQIKRRFDVLIFVSFGEVGCEGLKSLYEAGARGLLLRFETSSAELYAQVHPGSLLKDRIAEIRAAADMGYLIVTGSLIGLPGQTDEDIARDLILARDLNVEMLSLGPVVPHPQTPLARIVRPSVTDVVQVLAAARFVLPAQAKILVTTGLETLDASARRAGLMAGANSVMLNVTPVAQRALYEIYLNRAHQDDPLGEQVEATKALLQGIGRAPTDLSVGMDKN
ncbi:MAG: [FeFe] hydrogenase H-cluster radical SAM maturase HydE [Candidatus Omnitrophica bacterium]|nr:[FeFe] hydrogenase H-cluster radical SAM maturase HydE [Candidatus Omnitrophota bacterium]